MAVMQATPQDQKVNSLHRGIKIPRNRYSIRCKEEEVGVSKSSGNPMYTLTWEIIAPDSVKMYDGSTLNVAGVEIFKKQYVALRSKNEDGTINTEKTQKMFDMYCDLRAKVGRPVPEGEGIDNENPPPVFKGIVVDAILDGEETIQRLDPTPEQRTKKEMGSPILDGDGKQIKGYMTYVVEILGPSSAEVSKTAGTRPF